MFHDGSLARIECKGIEVRVVIEIIDVLALLQEPDDPISNRRDCHFPQHFDEVIADTNSEIYQLLEAYFTYDLREILEDLV